MLDALRINEAVDGVINLKDIGESATAIIPPVERPLPGDVADVYIGKDGAKLGTATMTAEGGVLAISREVLLKYSGNIDTPFYYIFFDGQLGNPYPSMEALYKIA
ncbi:hypothetical protein [Pseudomonas sp. AIG]